MRPTEPDGRSSLAVPPALLVACAVLVVAALVAAALPRDVPLYVLAVRRPGMSEVPHGADVPAPDGGLTWYPGPRTALGAGAVMPMFVLFTDPADPKCQRLSRGLFGDRWSAMRIGSRFVCVRIVPGSPAIPNDDSGARLMKEQGVYVLPTILLLAPDGTPGDRIEGYPGRAEIMRRVTKWSDRYQKQAVTAQD